MKLSKNVLVGSLATTGMILGMVAPATTAFAATTSGAYNADGSVVATESNTADAGSLNDSSTVAIADYDGRATDAPVGASAQSNANVTVLSGILSLDAVPDFGFGNGAAGSTVNLKNNEASGDGVDGNDKGQLSVIDSRSAADGFTLGATLGEFSNGTTTTPAVTGFNLTLNPQELVDSQGNDVSSTATNLSKTTTESASLSDTNKTPTNVIDLASGAYKNGTISTTFTGEDAATLAISKDAKQDKANVSSYKSVITWTLAPAAAVVNP